MRKMMVLLMALCAGAFCGVPAVSAQAPAAKKPAAWDLNGDGKVQSGKEASLYACYKKYPDLADIDFSRNCRMDGAAEIAAYNARIAKDGDIDINKIEIEGKIGKAGDFEPTSDKKKEQDTKKGLLIRKAYENVTVLNEASEVAKAAPATASYTADWQKNTYVGAISGSATYFWRNAPENAFTPGKSRVTGTALNVGMIVDRQFRSGAPGQTLNSWTVRAGGEIETQGGFFSQNYFRASPFYSSDFDSSFGVVGGEAEWEITNDDWAIGVPHRLAETPLSLIWRPILHAEYQRLVMGTAPKQFAGYTNFGLVGPVIAATLSFDTAKFQNFYVDAAYWGLFDLANGSAYRPYWEVSGNLNLDEDKRIAITAKYRQGIAPKSHDDLRDFTIGLGVKR